ncbi:MAG: glucosyl-3-phosphoglycerate synthase [Chloroflexi bacterium]|nr:glucosyl-3-phosphoglycerate synthase [Chloroflexota bacterium]
MGQERYKILVAMGDIKVPSNLAMVTDTILQRRSRSLLKIASALLHHRSGHATLLRVVEAPIDSLAAATAQARAQRQLLREVARYGDGEFAEVKTMVRVAPQAWQGIREAVMEEKADLLVLEWGGRRGGRLFGATIRELASAPPCDLAVIKWRDGRPCRSILLPVRGGPHADLALGLASTLAQTFGASITVMHVDLADQSWRQRDRERRTFVDFLTRCPPGARPLVVTATSAADALLAEAKKHQLVIMGAAAQAEPAGPWGAIPQAVVSSTETSVMVVKTREPVYVAQLEAKAEAPGVDKWFAENTFLPREFSDIEELVRLKQSQGLTISLCLPSFNEEETIGPLIRLLKEELMQRQPLLDEIALMDGGSTDGTVDIARQEGIPAYYQRVILPEYGSHLGKGEALWKSLFMLKGDILAWVDTDIRNVHPKFVYMVVGPLLKEERIQLVKGFCGRTWGMADAHPSSGYYLTELTVRPLLNLFFPQLSGLVDTVGGGCAGRRRVLEQLPFFTGSGVELGLLLDVWFRFGLSAIAQADLEERIDRSWPVVSLTPRALALTQIVLKRVAEYRGLSLGEEARTMMNLIQAKEDSIALETMEIMEVERPPMLTIPQYLARWPRLYC